MSTVNKYHEEPMVEVQTSKGPVMIPRRRASMAYLETTVKKGEHVGRTVKLSSDGAVYSLEEDGSLIRRDKKKLSKKELKAHKKARRDTRKLAEIRP